MSPSYGVRQAGRRQPGPRRPSRYRLLFDGVGRQTIIQNIFYLTSQLDSTIHPRVCSMFYSSTPNRQPAWLLFLEGKDPRKRFARIVTMTA